MRLVPAAIPQIEHDAGALLGNGVNLGLVAARRQQIGGGKPLIMLLLPRGGCASQDTFGKARKLAVSGRRGEDTIEKLIQPKAVGIGKVTQQLKRGVSARWLERSSTISSRRPSTI
jgi:hypothetical protein